MNSVTSLPRPAPPFCSQAESDFVAKLLSYCTNLGSVTAPEAVLDGLHEVTDQALGLKVLCAGRFPQNMADWGALRLGKTVFLHESAPKGWWEEWLQRAPDYNPVSYFMARISIAPYTLTEMSRMLEPVGADRWGLELALKYGIRDGFICPVGGRWLVAFWSPQVLTRTLTEPRRIILFAAASFAAVRLDQLLKVSPESEEAYTRLTARELAAIRLLSWGKDLREIAEALGLGEETIRTHFKKAKTKLGAKTQPHMVATAMRQRQIL